MCTEALKSRAEVLASCAYRSVSRINHFIDRDTNRMIKERLPFWKHLNEAVINLAPFAPFKLFKHGAQSLYSKTRYGVDGGAQARAILRS